MWILDCEFSCLCCTWVFCFNFRLTLDCCVTLIIRVWISFFIMDFVFFCSFVSIVFVLMGSGRKRLVDLFMECSFVCLKYCLNSFKMLYVEIKKTIIITNKKNISLWLSTDHKVSVGELPNVLWRNNLTLYSVSITFDLFCWL